MHREDKIWLLVTFLFVLVAIGFWYLENKNCDGTLVRGMFWFECIKK